MNLDRLAQYYHDPSLLAEHPLAELEELVQEYPYFTAGHLLLLKQYRLQNSSRYKKQHRKILTLAPDPVRAFMFTEGDAWSLADENNPVEQLFENVVTPEVVQEIATVEPVTAMNENAQEMGVEDRPVQTMEVVQEMATVEPVNATNEIIQEMEVEDLQLGTPSAQETQGDTDFLHKPHDLQDWFRFYARSSHMNPPVKSVENGDADYERELRLAATTDLLNAPSGLLLPQDLEAIRVKVSDELGDPLSADSMHTIRKLAQASIDGEQLPASETLAEVFAGQQEWDYAIAIYQQLILMNPEKMPIFAARIAQLKQAKT